MTYDHDTLYVQRRNVAEVGCVQKIRWVYVLNGSDSKPYPTKEKAWCAAMRMYDARIGNQLASARAGVAR